MINHQNGLDESVATLWELVWPTIPPRSSTHLGCLGGPLHCTAVGGTLVIYWNCYNHCHSLQWIYHSTSRSWNMITTAVPPWDGISSLWTFCPWKELITRQLFHWNRCDHYQVPCTMSWNFPSRLSLNSMSLNQWQTPLHDEHRLWEVALFEPEASWSNTTKSGPIGKKTKQASQQHVEVQQPTINNGQWRPH